MPDKPVKIPELTPGHPIRLKMFVDSAIEGKIPPRWVELHLSDDALTLSLDEFCRRYIHPALGQLGITK